MKLSTRILSELSSRNVAVPKYDRSKIKGGILHVGVGNFHRAHMAAYVEDLLQKDFEVGKEWGIIGSGMLPFDQLKRDALQPQEWLQTLVEHDANVVKPRVLGCMLDFLPIDTKAVEMTLRNPDVKIVSLTVTEGGYFLSDGKLDVTNPQIQHDIDNPDDPKTIFGVLCKAAKYRKENNLPLFTILSCDNIPHNGDVTKSVVVGLAQAQGDESLASWLGSFMAFPNSMVDRITPATSWEQINFLQNSYGYEDAAPIFCEPFRQWVLEDHFSPPDARPPLDLLDNVIFVPDVRPYELMKIRILNGGHASLCYPSALLDLHYVHESMQHETIRAFLDSLQRHEIIPTIPHIPNIDLNDYWQTVANRFSNPTLRDTITRICSDGANRQPKFIVGTIRDNIEKGHFIHGMALVSALWCRYCQGKTESGKLIPPNDPHWDRLQDLAFRAMKTPRSWLDGLPDVYGKVLSPFFVTEFEKACQSIQTNGVESALKEYIVSVTKTTIRSTHDGISLE